MPVSGIVIESIDIEYAPVAVSTPAEAPGASDGVPDVTTSFIPLETALSAGLEALPTSSVVEMVWGDDCGANAMDCGDDVSATGEPSSVDRKSTRLNSSH